jgi:AcrR family transcriptional regulator
MAQPEKPERRTRGRPVRSTGQIADMRAQIAACAQKLFHREGYAAISMRRLAQETGCTAMTLYKYYNNKFDILQVLWADVFGELFDDLDRIAAAERDPKARLTAVALGYVTYWLEHREHYFMVFMSGGLSQADVTGFVSSSQTLARFDLLRTSLDIALGGDTDPEELRTKAELLLCMLNGIAHNLITIGGYPWSDHEKLVRRAIDGLLAG